MRTSLVALSALLCASCTSSEVQHAALTQGEIARLLTIACTIASPVDPRAALVCAAGVPTANALTLALSDPALQQWIINVSTHTRQ